MQSSHYILLCKCGSKDTYISTLQFCCTKLSIPVIDEVKSIGYANKHITLLMCNRYTKGINRKSHKISILPFSVTFLQSSDYTYSVLGI